MLRLILVLVIVANVLFLAWSQHWLAPLGLVPSTQSEPERLQRQINPEMIRLHTPPAASAASATQ